MLKNLKARPLKRIPDPPKEVREWQILSHGLDHEDTLERARKTMRKTFPEYLGVLRDYNYKLAKVVDHNIGWADMALALGQVEIEGEGISPLEKKEVRETDYKKHGRAEWLLVIGFDHRRIGNEVKRKLIYMKLEVDKKKELLDMVRGIQSETLELELKAGPQGYPEAWDKEEFDDTF